MNDLVSIIVPTFNRLHLLPRTLESLVNQSHKNIEVIVINDAGEDINSVIEKFNDKRIKLINNETNLGLAGTRNVGLRNSTGDWICLCDDDDIYLQYAIETRLYYAHKLNAEIVYTRALKDIWRKTDQGYVSVGKQLYWDSKFHKDLILIQNIAPCSNVLFSRKSWEESEYWFDEDLSTTEDHDLWIALSRKFYFHELKLIDTECSYREDKTQMTGSKNFAPNWIKVFKKWRHTAEDYVYVVKSQNDILRRAGINPEDYGL